VVGRHALQGVCAKAAWGLYHTGSIAAMFFTYALHSWFFVAARATRGRA
jgi:hypothetical protein